VVAAPQGTNDPPTFAFGTSSPVSITDSSAGTASMTISTTASGTTPCTAAIELPRNMPSQHSKWSAGGGTILACALLFGISQKRRKLLSLLGALLLLVTMATGISACNNTKSTACTPVSVPGTTTGPYTITVTATSGSMVTTGTVTLTVQ
jgi:hypothetical protein